MSFKITITETRMVNKIAGKDWAEVGEEEVARDDAFCSDPDAPKTRLTKVYDYTPEITKVLPETREVLSQVVGELDLKAVVKAINGL
jgi:hypothetical protein